MSLVTAESAVLSHDPALLSPEACLVRDGSPLTATQRYVYQHWLAAQLQTSYDECECAACRNEGEADCEAQADSLEADDARDAARAAWLASDDEREYEISDDQDGWTITSTPDEVESDAEASLREGDWDASEGTLHLSAYVYAVDPVTEERAGDLIWVSVDIEPEEPDCAEGEAHDWCAPHSVLGGLRENPGVWGHGAGIQTRRVCSHCGAYQLYESAAQDGATGSYYQSTSYEEADEDSLAWIRRRRDDAMIEACPYSITNHNRRGPGDYRVGVEVDANDDEACDAILAEIRDAIGPGWSVEWTGNGNGDKSDISIEWEG